MGGIQAAEWTFGGGGGGGGGSLPASVLPSGTGGFLGPLGKQVAHVEGHKLLAFSHRCRVLSPNAAPSQPKENGVGC